MKEQKTRPSYDKIQKLKYLINCEKKLFCKKEKLATLKLPAIKTTVILFLNNLQSMLNLTGNYKKEKKRKIII